ncbi:MAG: von Willebrand factor type A domain-containing protein [Deltaproteobacteria bacterium]|nr:von Willebrand factor type A domain-containing protein [Deltaproteobacteria bacterium]
MIHLTKTMRPFLLLAIGMLLWGCAGDSGDMIAKNAGSSDEGEYYDDMAADPNFKNSTNQDEDLLPEERKANEGDKFEAVGTNPFVMVAHDPFSTFAADVDTASYDIFRRDVNYGYLPQAASVRLEEFVNYFAYAYPTPTAADEHPFTVSLAGGDSIDGQLSVLRVAIAGRPAAEFVKKPANVVFLVDVSGSMIDVGKLPLVQYSLTKTLDVLDAGDTVSIVKYAGSVGVALPPTSLENRTTIEAAIASLNSGGSTSGAAGITLAYQQAEAAFKEGGINHVILCTDGDFNVGPSSNEELVQLIEEKRESGITLTVLGFGSGNLNDSMMEALSNAGNGVYGVIASEAQAAEYVENRMLSALQYIAKDMKIQVEFNPALVKAYRLLGYENREIADEDFVDDTVDAGEIGAGHRVTALYEVVTLNGAIPQGTGAPTVDDGVAQDGVREIAPGDLVLVKVRYKDVDAKATDAAYELRVSATPDVLDHRMSETDPDFQFASAVAAYAEILKESPYANPANLPTIEQIITGTNWLAADRAEFAQLFTKAKAMSR